MIALLEWPRVWGVRMLLLRSSLALRRAEQLAAASYRAEDEAAALLAEARTIAHGRLALAVAASRRGPPARQPCGKSTAGRRSIQLGKARENLIAHHVVWTLAAIQ